MATAGEGGPTGSTGTNSSYGAGGKFRKKPLRRATTPYERPPPLLRPNTDGSWLKKMVVDSASKFISYGANRFFAPLFRKRLTTPTPPPRSEVNHETSEDPQGLIPNIQHVAQEHQNGDNIQAISNSSNQGISDLEQLLKQKTFTRSEIDHLTDLLQSRVVEVSVRDERENKAVIVSDSGRVQQFGYGHSNHIGNGVIRSNGVTSTPIFSSKVIEENVASPVELAKAYMGKQPSNVSPPIITASTQALERSPLLTSTMFALKSPMTARTPVKHGGLENGFITPRSRGRSAIYNMARTPYSRVLPTSTLKGNGFNGNGYAGSSLSLLEPAEKLESKSMTLKRRSSTLDDEIGSVGPIRRIRQKPNLLTPRISHSARGLGIDSGKQKLNLIDGASKAVEKDENESTPSTSYGRVPANSSKVAARILQHLENLGSAEKPSESKLVAVRDKPFQLKQSMLHGKALRSMEDVNAFELPLQDIDNVKELSNVESDKRDSISLTQGEVQENGPKESVLPSHKRKPAKDNGSSMSLKASGPSYPSSNLIVRNNVSQPPQKKRAFRMSFEEDSIEQDDDLQSNGVTLEPHDEEKVPLDARLLNSNLAPATIPGTLNTTTQPEVTSSSGLLPIKPVESGDTSSVKFGEGSSSILFGATTEASTPFSSAVSSVSTASSDKPGQANPPTLIFGTKVPEKVPSFNIEPSTKVPEPKLESSSSLTSTTTTISSQPEKYESDKDAPVNPPKLADGFGKSENDPVAASNEPVVSKPIFSFGSSSLNLTDQIPLNISPFFVPTNTSRSFTSANSTRTTSTTSFGSMFGSPSISTQPAITFGASTGSAPSIPNISGDAEAQTKPDCISQPTTQACSFGFSAPAKPSVENNLQGSSLFDKPINSGDENSQKVAKVEPVVSSLPPFTMNNNNTSFGSSPSFGFSSSAVSTDATKTTTFSFGLNSQSSATTTSVSAPSPAAGFTFGVNASGSSDSLLKFNASSSTPPLFNFSAASASAPSATFNFGSSSSAAPSPGINTTSSSSNAIFNFGASSTTPNSNTTTSTIALAPANPFGGNTWKNPNTSMFGTSSPAPSTGFAFGSTTTTSTPPVFSFAASTPLPSTTPAAQPIFPTFGGGSGFGNSDQMHAEDSMAEDNPVQQQQAPHVPAFGQLPVNAPQTGFMFGGQMAPTQANPFQFNTQQGQGNPNPFQASGSFSLGTTSDGGNKSGRRIIKPSRSKNRKK